MVSVEKGNLIGQDDSRGKGGRGIPSSRLLQKISCLGKHETIPVSQKDYLPWEPEHLRSKCARAERERKTKKDVGTGSAFFPKGEGEINWGRYVRQAGKKSDLQSIEEQRHP